MKVSYKKALEMLTEYAYSEGYDLVDLEHVGVSKLHFEQSIHIQGDCSDEYKVYYFLHELGHHILRKDKEAFKKAFPLVYRVELLRSKPYKRKLKRRREYFVDALNEEYMAWEEGLKLAVEMGLHLHKRNWKNVRTGCLMAYIRYYSSI